MRSFASLAFLGMFVACAEAEAPSAPRTIEASPASQSAAAAVNDAAKAPSPNGGGSLPTLTVETQQNSAPIIVPTVGKVYTAHTSCPAGTVAVGGGVQFVHFGTEYTFPYAEIRSFGLSNLVNGFMVSYSTTQQQAFSARVTAHCIRLS